MIEILVVQLHRRRSKRYITLSSRRSDSANNGISILEILEILYILLAVFVVALGCVIFATVAAGNTHPIAPPA